MGLDFSCAALSAQTRLWLLLEKAFQEIAQLVSGVGRDVGIAELDLVEELRPALGVEGREPDHHFVDEGAEAPPVNGLAVALLVEYFGGEVFGSAADGVGVIVSDVHFGEAEISEAQVALFVDEDVFGLEAAWGKRYSR